MVDSGAGRISFDRESRRHESRGVLFAEEFGIAHALSVDVLKLGLRVEHVQLHRKLVEDLLVEIVGFAQHPLGLPPAGESTGHTVP
ncbi:MAG: hypothetical protein BRD41_03275 [Bacteroidetes bacterium QS_1_63_11]|nr:MAG: hypothetical protein BRD41_03275 [Bacteroidetes bacterium QS_1_63_11]